MSGLLKEMHAVTSDVSKAAVDTLNSYPFETIQRALYWAGDQHEACVTKESWREAIVFLAAATCLAEYLNARMARDGA